MTLREKSWYPILYMFAVTVFFSAIVILFGSITRQRVKDNERIAFERAVLQALPIEIKPGTGPSTIHTIYTQKVREPDQQSAGALRYFEGDSLRAYALPLEGPGFWAPIKGVIGIETDLSTITGIAFYEQNETPGLGGEIVGPEFRRQFIGRKIAKTGVPIQIVPPAAALNDNSVHAITGATQTSTRLGRFMNKQIAAWRDRMVQKP
jgi:Na+-transporting NADH:ubiquinone oxidoreductase subunit C